MVEHGDIKIHLESFFCQCADGIRTYFFTLSLCDAHGVIFCTHAHLYDAYKGIFYMKSRREFCVTHASKQCLYTSMSGTDNGPTADCKNKKCEEYKKYH